jgi:hypothetical protein
MNTMHKNQWTAQPIARTATLIAGLSIGLVLAGCGTPGAPKPPSLKLPEPVTDLSASRAGNQVTLTWTMPRRNTDKLLLKGNVTVRVCRKENTGMCNEATAALSFAPGTAGTFTETLPAALSAGAPRPLSYFVEMKNRSGRSAGPSNAAQVLAGKAPAPVANLTAEMRKQGVVLRWTATNAAARESSPEAIRLHRKLLNPPATKPHEGLFTPPPEPVEENLLVDAGADRALDQSIRFGQSYEYRAQRVARNAVDGETLELAGELSSPVSIKALDVFPPTVPTGLEAVATTGENAAETAIDLSWQPVTDSDLAGYIVYRREGQSDWQRISPAGPLVPPAFHDAQIQPGHTYHYAVSAIDQGGHESARSAEAEETVPTP